MGPIRAQLVKYGSWIVRRWWGKRCRGLSLKHRRFELNPTCVFSNLRPPHLCIWQLCSRLDWLSYIFRLSPRPVACRHSYFRRKTSRSPNRLRSHGRNLPSRTWRANYTHPQGNPIDCLKKACPGVLAIYSVVLQPKDSFHVGLYHKDTVYVLVTWN